MKPGIGCMEHNTYARQFKEPLPTFSPFYASPFTRDIKAAPSMAVSRCPPNSRRSCVPLRRLRLACVVQRAASSVLACAPAAPRNPAPLPTPPSQLPALHCPQAAKTLKDVFEAFCSFGAGAGPVAGLEGRMFSKCAGA